MHKVIKKHSFTQRGIGFDNIADYGVIIESKPILESILEYYDDVEIISSYHLDYDWFYIERNGTRIVFAVSQGASMVVDLAERYASSGIKYIVRIGTTGALTNNVKLGELVVAYAAIKDEGTSKFYISPEAPAIANIPLVQSISTKMRDSGLIVHNGIVWTTDGRWRETDESIKMRVADGAMATDMESAALFAFGICKHIAVASISILSDEIYNAAGDQKGLSDEEVWYQKVLPTVVKVFLCLVGVYNKIQCANEKSLTC